MFGLEEQALVEEAQRNLEEFLQKEQRSLITFTGDSHLQYLPEPKRERFLLKPSQGILYLPLASFMERDLDENQMLWHIYYELARYPDWKKNPSLYLNRHEVWQKEIDHMAAFLLQRIETEGLTEDPAYQPSIVAHYVKQEILDFLHAFDEYSSFLRVLQLCPYYRDEEPYSKIVAYMERTGKTLESLSSMQKQRAFAQSFLPLELYQISPQQCEAQNNPFLTEMLGQSLFDFVHTQLIRQIQREEGIVVRDPFLRSFVYPVFMELWKEEIAEMNLEASSGQKQEQVKTQKKPTGEEKVEEESLESTREEEKKVLEELLEEQEQQQKNQGNMQGKVDLVPYGITAEDQELFQFYSRKMQSQREQMRQFWQKLIGEAKKERSVKKEKQIKGKLSVPSLIDSYPDFVEAERKGSYKNLPIFNRYLLETQANILPERIEISFLVDNSGSMNEAKIEAARKALAVTLLSIDDFNEYLKRNAEQLHQKIEVLSEVWFFGSSYYNVKELNDTGSKEKKQSDMIRSIVKLDATDGATDDASCLQEIADRITPQQKQELKKGKQIKIVFEITDGASSFPGRTKQAVQELLAKNVILYAFQIGENSPADQKTFQFVWNDGYKEPHGIFIGEQVETLPQALLTAVGNNLEEVFRNAR